MNCPLCVGICTCGSKDPGSAPRWTPDARAYVKGVSFSSVENTEPATSSHGEEVLQSAVQEDESARSVAPASDLAEFSPVGRSKIGDQPADPAAWRDEVAARLDHYRARRRPRPPRYPSLELIFDRPNFNLPIVGATAAAADTSRSSTNALALNACQVSHPAPPDLDSAIRPSMLPVPPTAQSRGAQKTNVIAFPHWNTGDGPAQANELAGPVMHRPRILDAPDFLPPLPALGGITIEAPPPEEIEKRPGIDMPLQTVSLGCRLIAALIDVSVIAVACALSSLIFWKIAGVRPPRFQLLALSAGAFCFCSAVYQFLLIVYSGSTLGLIATRLELAGFNGSPASRSRRRWRVLASYLSALSLGMGYAWVFLDEDRLCWHDRISHTYLAAKRNSLRPGEQPAGHL